MVSKNAPKSAAELGTELRVPKRVSHWVTGRPRSESAEESRIVSRLAPSRVGGGNPTRSDNWTALLIVLAIIALVLVVIFVPRPNIRLTSVRYETSSCDPVTSSVLATAHVTLINTGVVDGYIVARFYVDGGRRATSAFFVAARATVSGTLEATIMGCVSHQYSIDTCYPSGDSTPTC